MFERFVEEARVLALEAQAEARASGSPTVEAEHVLLALAGDTGGLGGEVLRGAGLDHAAIRQSLDEEFERSLRAVGVALDALGTRQRLPFTGRPRWAASGKAALERALGAAHARGDRRIEAGHVLLGVLAARDGTVPRALQGTGVEPGELEAATHAAMGHSSR
ncbi:MAG TPA: Clp protease N-terminal domain-containing protein [Solirubrobacteraceae bacterium]|nr:Clp protease N-terminal domain-containing protein [Solirubrobacteraceae bacterium]